MARVYMSLKVEDYIKEWLERQAKKMTNDLRIPVGTGTVANMIFEKAMREEKR